MRRFEPWTHKEIEYLKIIRGDKKHREEKLVAVAKELERSVEAVRTAYYDNVHDKKEVEYALYKGEDLLDIGTMKEIAKREGIKETTARFLASPANKKRNKGNRRIMVRL